MVNKVGGLVARVVAISLVAVVGLTACGDDAEPLTEEEFAEQGNALCDEGSGAAEEIFTDLDDEPTEEELDAAIGEFADEIDEQIDAIRDLDAPEEIAGDVDAALDQAADDVEGLREQGAAALESSEDPFAASRPLLNEVGLTSCAED